MMKFLRRMWNGEAGLPESPEVTSVVVEGRDTSRGLGFFQTLILREVSAESIEPEARSFLESRGDTFVRVDGPPRRVPLDAAKVKAVDPPVGAVVGATGRSLFALDEK